MKDQLYANRHTCAWDQSLRAGRRNAMHLADPQRGTALLQHHHNCLDSTLGPQSSTARRVQQGSASADSESPRLQGEGKSRGVR